MLDSPVGKTPTTTWFTNSPLDIRCVAKPTVLMGTASVKAKVFSKRSSPPKNAREKGFGSEKPFMRCRRAQKNGEHRVGSSEA
eukprot:CAMPEP_0115712672 /NCGR_PEP_ID=MMETSP0272-20121206/74256_1 /TAXON_ID=71861 /ORGANISM="Scrippsiella trochoidea, Strain CCMP3099" /LENGTH=82 /DNA_ID=CAMNT_0003154617 /DNA_START=228 /DNA_END=476 /DNA_ORIENTATION=+